jgi:hypothetical protein
MLKTSFEPRTTGPGVERSNNYATAPVSVQIAIFISVITPSFNLDLDFNTHWVIKFEAVLVYKPVVTVSRMYPNLVEI